MPATHNSAAGLDKQSRICLARASNLDDVQDFERMEKAKNEIQYRYVCFLRNEATRLKIEQIVPAGENGNGRLQIGWIHPRQGSRGFTKNTKDSGLSYHKWQRFLTRLSWRPHRKRQRCKEERTLKLSWKRELSPVMRRVSHWSGGCKYANYQQRQTCRRKRFSLPSTAL